MRLMRLRVLTIAACTALALAACGGGGGGGTSGGAQGSDGNTLEVFSWWTSGSEDAALKELIKAFETANPGVKVTNGAVAGGGGGNAQAVLQTRLQGNDAPDTWQTHPGAAINQYIDSNLVADLSSVYGQDNLSEVVPKSLIDSVSKDGKMYGVSTGAHRGNVLWYNKKLTDKAGVNPSAGYTATQFVADLAKLKSQGTTPICLGAKDTFATPQLFENTLLSVTGPDGWNTLTSGQTKWDDPKVKEAAGLFAQMLPYVDPDSSALTWDQATKRLADGQCAFESMGDWAYGELVKGGAKEGTDFGYVPHAGTDGSFVLVVDTFVVGQNAKHPELGQKWASAISTTDAQLAFNKEKGSTPVRTDVDVSTLPKYQQAAAKSFRSDSHVQSIVHGEAMNPQFQLAFSDAVTQFVQSKDVDTFVQALAAAAQ
jgi:glucose/mannose transport system substrate-binding protein